MAVVVTGGSPSVSHPLSINWVRTKLDWTEILQNGGVEEPPGYRETVEAIKAEPYVKPSKKAKGKKKR